MRAVARKFIYFVTVSACHVVACGLAAGQASTQSDALRELEAHVAAMKDVRTLEMEFVCEKRLAMLEEPLVSSGRLWIRKGGGNAGNAVRFSTEKPYVSEVILAGGKMHVRSQHEQKWTTTDQSARPGLAVVMMQLGGWSTGEAGKLGETYGVSRARESVPDAPKAADVAGTQLAMKADGLDVYDLVPLQKDLAAVVRRVRVAMERQTHKLAFIEIESRGQGGDAAGGDVTRYWFLDAKINAALPEGVFDPRDRGR